MRQLFRGLIPVCRKEFLHIVRDPGTLFFALLIPILQLFLFGFAVDTNIRQIATVVLDESQTQESRRLLESFAGSDVFALRIYATSQDGMYEAIRSGKARAGIRIPYDYARRLQDGTGATVLVLVDGSAQLRAWRCRNRWCACCRMARCQLRCGRRCCTTRPRGRRISLYRD
jgi:ABC-2 type transport system permease protein